MRQMINQFQKQRKEINYTNVVVFTNQGNEYEHQNQKKIFGWNNNESLSVVYLGDTEVTVYPFV